MDSFVFIFQVGPLGRRSLQQLAARTALSGTNRVFYGRAGYCTRLPRSPPVGRGRHQRTQRPLPLRLSLAFKLHACRITPAWEYGPVRPSWWSLNVAETYS